MQEMKNFKGRINYAADVKKEKSELSKRAQQYLLKEQGSHDKNPNVIVYKLDDSNLVVIDADNKYTHDYVEHLLKKNNIDCIKTPSIRNVLFHDDDENKYRYHYWFRSTKPLEKKLRINQTELDFLTKELVFEHIDSNIDFAKIPILPDVIYKGIFEIPNPNMPTVVPIVPTVVPIVPIVPTVVPTIIEVIKETETETETKEPTYLETQMAWIDKNTKVVDARSYQTWSHTIFKIYNKYGGNNIGRKMAHHFSKKDEKTYDEYRVDSFWNNIKREKIDCCVFGLTDEQREAMRNQLFESYTQEMIQQTKKNVKQRKKNYSKSNNNQDNDNTNDNDDNDEFPADDYDDNDDNDENRETEIDFNKFIQLKNATDECASMQAYKIIKKNYKYSRGQFFFKKNNLWSCDPDTFKASIHIDVQKLKMFYAETVMVNGKEKKIWKKYCDFLKKLNAVVTLVKYHITNNPDDHFYDKLHSTVKGKLVFLDGVYNFKTKEFNNWESEELKVNPVYSIGCCPHKFPKEDSVSKEFKDECIEKIYGAFTQKQKNDILHFLARAAAGHIEDKLFAQQLMNRDSGKGIQCDWISHAFGKDYVGCVDYTNFILQQNTNDDSAKSNGWLLPFQFKRFMLANESKGDINDKRIKIDGGKLKSVCSGGDEIEARALYQNPINIKIQSTLMIMCNDTLPCSTPDVFDKCLQISGQCQYKSQQFIKEKYEEAKDNPELLDIYKRKFRLEDAELKDIVKTLQWSNALIRILIDNYKPDKVHIEKTKTALDENETSLDENIIENYIVGNETDFISNDELRIDAEQFKVSLKKLKQNLNFCFDQKIKEGKHKDGETRKQGIFGLKYKNE
jgi:hypothetical protein